MSRKVGTALLVLGLLALLATAGMVGYGQVRRVLMREQMEALRQTPVTTPLPPTGTVAPSPAGLGPATTPSPTAAVPTATPSSTAPRPTATPSPTVPQPSLPSTETAPAPQGRPATPTRMPTEAPLTPTAAPMPPTPTPPAAPLPPARPVRMVVPAIGLDIPVVEVGWVVQERNGVRTSAWETASYAAGHHRDSANPGERGNVVLSGHHNIEGEVFREISNIGEPGARLRLGDKVILYRADGLAFVYRIVEWHRFREAGTSAEEQLAHARFLEPSSEPILTLVTCWPYVSNTHRVVVVAELAGPYAGP